MELFVIRHAIAVPGSMLLADADRPLTPKGRTRFSQGIGQFHNAELLAA